MALRSNCFVRVLQRGIEKEAAGNGGGVYTQGTAVYSYGYSQNSTLRFLAIFCARLSLERIDHLVFSITFPLRYKAAFRRAKSAHFIHAVHVHLMDSN